MSARSLAVLLAAVFVLTALLAFLAPLGLAPLVALAGAACLSAPRVAASRRARLALGGLFLWASVSVAWSPARPWLEARSLVSAIEHLTVLQLGLFAVLAALLLRAALALPPAQARLPAIVLRGSVLALAVLLLAESLDGAWIYGGLARLLQPDQTADLVRIYAARGGYVLAVMMWPWLAVLTRRSRWLAPAPVLAVIGVCALLRQDAPLAALAAGAVACAVAWLAGGRGVAALAAIQALFWLAGPWLVLLAAKLAPLGGLAGRVKPSWSARLDIWGFAASKAAEHPWRGWGLDAARAFGDRIPLHTHNWSLQLWLELGLPGAVLVAGLWLGLGQRVAAMEDRLQRAAAAGAMSAYLTIGAVSFGLWQAWWLAAGVLAALAAIVAARAAGQKA